jgi:hypothetical protein
MKFCDAAACSSCPLREDVSACLRQKAQFCGWLMTKTYTSGIRTALEKMILQLMEEADAVEKEKALRITTVSSF